MEKQSTYLSVVIPVYNEQESLSLLHAGLSAVLQEQGYAYEVVYVDDGSTDGSAVVLQHLMETDPHLLLVRLRRNFGQTAALAAGVAHSQGQVLAFMDADLQNDPADIPRLLEKLEEGYDLVSGWRRERRDAGLTRRLPSRLANSLIARLSGVPLHDSGCTLKVYRRALFEHIHLYGEMHRLIPAYAALAGASIAELEVRHHPRRYGRSKYGLDRAVRVILDLLLLKFSRNFATKPHYAFGSPGLLALLLCLLSLLGLLPMPIQRRRAGVLARHSLLSLAGGCFLFGALSLMLALLAEMVMRVYYEAQARPPYSVRSVLAQADLPGHGRPSQSGAAACVSDGLALLEQ
jgi:glycosyltransferase involved in cell wall biosynthesis